MFIQRNKRKVGDKVYQSILLQESYRESGKVKHRHILNITSWKPEQIEALDMALKGNKGLKIEDIETKQGESIGLLWVFTELAKELGLFKILGAFFALVLILIVGRISTQGSRLRLVDWGKTQAIETVLEVDGYSKDTLYGTLDWLCENQERIEDDLFRAHTQQKPCQLFLYDVTSSYVEGECNELAEYGYNRDKKQGKKQIVIGLLTNEEGTPVAIEAFPGNTSDVSTVSSQIKKITQRFKAERVTMVGDRGMLKSNQIKELNENNLSYITAITKPQIETLLKQGILQLGLFDEEVMEVEDGGIRYIFRRNPVRAKEIEKSRNQKQDRVNEKVEKLNLYLSEHPKAKVETALKELRETVERLNMSDWMSAESEGRRLFVRIEEQKLNEKCKLDGCYVIKTDLSQQQAKAEVVHARYKDLSQVEYAFRTLKSGFLEIRPLYVQKESRTRGHVFVSMLAYLLIQKFRKRTKHLGMTLEHMIEALEQVQTVHLVLPTGETVTRIPTPPQETQDILDALGIKLPKNL